MIMPLPAAHVSIINVDNSATIINESFLLAIELEHVGLIVADNDTNARYVIYLDEPSINNNVLRIVCRHTKIERIFDRKEGILYLANCMY